MCHFETEISLLKRAKRKVNNEKMSMIADAIFQSKLRYGIAAYGSPKFEFNHMEQPMDPNLAKLQVVQNDMLRILNGKTRGDLTNMQKLREELKIMSVNQLSVYHTAMEMFNIVNNASSEPLQRKINFEQRGYQLRSLAVVAVVGLIKQTRSYLETTKGIANSVFSVAPIH